MLHAVYNIIPNNFKKYIIDPFINVVLLNCTDNVEIIVPIYGETKSL